MSGSSGWDLAEAGMAIAISHKDPDWKRIALDAIYRAACELPYLTADDVWRRFPAGCETDYGSALGPLMRQAKANRWISQTGHYKAAAKPSMHCKYRPLWRSHLYVDSL